ncbi:hypothetical protein [Mucilaginibacter endophyticus]|uniref:hypothetical protein n=1 Tax=Mucilaginibacter endophyticus TaxID=2675003 RepID=UPI000E0CCC29|nr:hypothetical protein [Mucilaginibacter endophyticus]
MKNFNGSKKISLKAGTVDAELYKTILEQDPGLKKLLVEPGLAAYLTSDGTTVEIYGAGFAFPDYLFMRSNVVVSYKVDDLEQMVGGLIHQGARLLGEIEHVCTSYKYCHLVTPEETVIGIYEQA